MPVCLFFYVLFVFVVIILFYLCTQACPYRLTGLSTSRPKAKRLIAFSRRYAPKNTIRLPPKSGTADTKEERNYSFLYLYMLLTISAAGFFAAHNNLFFIIHFFMYACHRSRMTAEVNCVSV